MQISKRSDKSFVHVPNLVCLQQVSLNAKIQQISNRIAYSEESVDTLFGTILSVMFTYLCQTRSSVKKIIVIVHNAKAFDLHFIVNRAVLLNCNCN